MNKYLSIVAASRNDNHGENMLHRVQVFVDGLISQCKKYCLDAELIIVEWNPPPNEERLYEVLEWTKQLNPLNIRFIEVPTEIHNKIENSEKIPFFQMIAKNTGIRRARGRFILATNTDLLFSDELMKHLSRKPLDPNGFYRVDRYDVGSKAIPINLSVEEQLKFCQQNVIRIHSLYSTKEVKNKRKWVPKIPKLMKRAKRIHTRASGDFTLMARDKWHFLKAYPELPKWASYIDGLFLIMAHVSGLRQVILPSSMKIYHIEHDSGFTAIPDRIRNIELSRKEYLMLCDKMLSEKRPITYNNDNWGFAHEKLKEFELH